MAVSKAIEKGSKKIICASTGNTSASAAAFGSYCGLETIVLIPEGKIAIGKLSQAVAYGAKIVSINGNFDQALNLMFYLIHLLLLGRCYQHLKMYFRLVPYLINTLHQVLILDHQLKTPELHPYQ